MIFLKIIGIWSLILLVFAVWQLRFLR